MVFGRDVYGFFRSLNVDLEWVRRAVQERLEIDLEPHENSYYGEYFCWSERDNLVRDVSVFENLEGPDVYGEIFPGHSPLIEIQCMSRAAADAISLKFASIPDLVVLRRFGARRRSFGPEDGDHRVRFDLLVLEDSYDEMQSHCSISLPYKDLMRIIALDPDDELGGVLELSAEQTDRLRQHTPDLAPTPKGTYAIDLNRVTREA